MSQSGKSWIRSLLTLGFVTPPWRLPCWIMLGVAVGMAGVVAQAINNDRRYDGPMGKSDRAFVMGLLAILLAFDLISASWVIVYLALVTLFALITLYNRMSKGIIVSKES